ncbi:hypothetical protein DFH08DRAFT_894776 [Mycena albidolilacea]|uniref:Uncharacterized protein n=1 Tax=Mycena albidolilacea TaxID=1033008 RepID=A0AAD6ZBT4_9AGAR|nr:hypothetical protein DFH08DRAFT_894776 [Mycena albidolilacea]
MFTEYEGASVAEYMDADVTWVFFELFLSCFSGREGWWSCDCADGIVNTQRAIAAGAGEDRHSFRVGVPFRGDRDRDANGEFRADGTRFVRRSLPAYIPSPPTPNGIPARRLAPGSFSPGRSFSSGSGSQHRFSSPASSPSFPVLKKLPSSSSRPSTGSGARLAPLSAVVFASALRPSCSHGLKSPYMIESATTFTIILDSTIIVWIVRITTAYLRSQAFS